MKKLLSFLMLSVMLCSCSSQEMGHTESGALVGTALGAGLGAIIGHETGNTGAGVAIGAGAGALTGALLGNEFEDQHDQIEDQERRLDQQDRIIAENRRLIEELRRRGVDVTQTKRGVVVNLPDVLFQFDKAELTSDAVTKVADIAEVVRQYPERQILVEGHTDSVGTLIYNKHLSEDRARSVANELVAEGVSRRRIVSAGFGESRPVSSNRTELGRQRNRRVEVIIQ